MEDLAFSFNFTDAIRAAIHATPGDHKLPTPAATRNGKMHVQNAVAAITGRRVQ